MFLRRRSLASSAPRPFVAVPQRRLAESDGKRRQEALVCGVVIGELGQKGSLRGGPEAGFVSPGLVLGGWDRSSPVIVLEQAGLLTAESLVNTRLKHS